MSPAHAIRSARHLGGLFLAALKACLTHRASSKAAALAFYTLFSVSPILVLVVAAAGAVLGTQAAQGELYEQWRRLVGPSGASALQQLVADAHVSGSGGMAAGIAGLLLVVGATTVFAELKDSLDEVWGSQAAVPAGLLGLLRTRLLSFGLVLVLSFLLLASLVVNAALALLALWWIPAGSGSTWLLAGLSSLATFAVITCLFAVIYRMLPERAPSWRHAWVGALCTAILFGAGKYAIGAYLGRSGVGSSFGAAGSLAALMIWVYYSAQIFFLGAEFTRLYAGDAESVRKDPELPGPAGGPRPGPGR
jgi:membrane protein